MITTYRLDELETLRPDDDQPDHVRVVIHTNDLRDLVALIPGARQPTGYVGKCGSCDACNCDIPSKGDEGRKCQNCGGYS